MSSHTSVFPVLCLCLVVLAPSAAPAAGAGLARQAGLAPGAAPAMLQKTTFARVPFGLGPLAIRPWQPGEVGEGVPRAFLMDGAGRVHLLIPHESAVLVLDQAGTPTAKVTLRAKNGSALPAASDLYDLAQDGAGNYLVLERTGGLVLRFGPDGLAKDAFGHFATGDCIQSLPDGSLAVRDVEEGVVSRFNGRGEFVGDVRDRAVAPVANARGEFARVLLAGGQRGFVWVRDPASLVPRLMALVDPLTPGGQLVELEPLGFDGAGQLHVLSTEKRPSGYSSYVYRLAPDGTTAGVVEVPALLELVDQVPRYYRLLPDGRLLTFHEEEGAYSLVLLTERT